MKRNSKNLKNIVTTRVQLKRLSHLFIICGLQCSGNTVQEKTQERNSGSKQGCFLKYPYH